MTRRLILIWAILLGTCGAARAADSSSISQAKAVLSQAADDLHAGKSEQALGEYQSAAALFEKGYGSHDESEIGRCLNGEGLCLEALNRAEGALAAYQASLDVYRHVHQNQDDPHVETELLNVALTLDNLGRSGDALPDYQAAFDMESRLCKGQDDPDLATAENFLGFCLFSLGRYDDALPHFQATLEMRRRIYTNQDNADIAASLNNVARCLDALGRSREALPVYQSALDMTRRLCSGQDSSDVATAMDNQAACMLSLGRASDALPVFQASLEMRQRLATGQDDADVATSLNNLATCLGALGKNEEALTKLQASLAMLQRIHNGQDSADVATAMANVARCLDLLGRSAEALPTHQAALAMRRRVYNDQDHPDIADSLTTLAGCFNFLGRFDDALLDYQQALKMYQRIYNNQDHPDVAGALSNVAVELDNLNQFGEALPLHQQALDMSKRLNGDQDHPDVAINLGLLAGCQLAMERYADALPNAQAALEMQQRIQGARDHPLVAWSLARVGLCLLYLDRKSEALTNDLAAMAMAQRLKDPDLYQYSVRTADVLSLMNRPADAAPAYQIAIDAFERTRSAFGGDDRDQMKVVDMQKLTGFDGYLGMMDAQIALNRPDKAAEYLDRGRAMSLLDILARADHQNGGDLLASVRAKARATGNIQLVQEIRDAAKDLTDAEENVSQLTSQINFARSINTSEEDAQIDELQPKLDDACRQYDAVRRKAYDLAEETSFSHPASAQEIQQFLKPHQHLLMYSISNNDVLLIVIPPKGAPVTATFLARGHDDNSEPGIALTKQIVRYRDAIISHREDSTRGVKLVQGQSTIKPSENLAADGADLFRKLMPVEVWHQIKDDDVVYIVPDLLMNGLPMETLIANDGSYWIDSGPAICYGPSAGALMKLSESHDSEEGKSYAHEAVLLGDPVLQRNAPEAAVAEVRGAALGEYGPLSPLPGTKTEVEGIYQALTGHPYDAKSNDSVVVLLGEDATGPRLADAVIGTRFLHLATHGIAKSGDDAIHSGIVLTQPKTPSAQDTGMLTLQDLFDHWGGKLTGTEMVVLSACDSQGIDEQGSNAMTDEGVYGLPWGFWYAGAPAVVASLWEVQDQSTSILMQRFYRNLESGKYPTKLAAFTAARKELKKQYPQPYFWSPFIYLGKPD
jgi:CHAT domain-containing protein/tetratricopeptide (TPR) repeat protein